MSLGILHARLSAIRINIICHRSAYLEISKEFPYIMNFPRNAEIMSGVEIGKSPCIHYERSETEEADILR